MNKKRNKSKKEKESDRTLLASTIAVVTAIINLILAFTK